MKHPLRTLLIALIALFSVDMLCTLVLNAARAQYVSHLERGAWWPQGYATFETIEFTLYAAVFMLLGTLFAQLFKRRPSAVALAFFVGAVYSLARFAMEPDLPFARYSHAPAWLWVLSWSQFYVPPIASGLGAVLHGTLIGGNRRDANAA
jgi:hypothetical protein